MQVITRCKKRVNIPTDNLFIHLDAGKGVNGGTALNGDSISIWEDQSGNNNHFIQTSGALQPTLETGGINGIPTVDFSSTTRLQASFNLLNSAISFFIVLKKESTYAGGYGSVLVLSSISNAAPGTEFIQINEGISPAYNLNLSTASLDRGLVTTSLDPRVFGVIKTLTNIESFVDGISIGSNNGVQGVNNNFHSIGSWGSNYFNGYISEFILYNRDLTLIETQQVNDYLTTKYAI